MAFSSSSEMVLVFGFLTMQIAAKDKKVCVLGKLYDGLSCKELHFLILGLYKRTSPSFLSIIIYHFVKKKGRLCFQITVIN